MTTATILDVARQVAQHADDGDGDHMDSWGHGGMMDWATTAGSGTDATWILIAVLIAGITVAIVFAVRGPQALPAGAASGAGSPREILDARLARGEIEVGEYQECLAALDGATRAGSSSTRRPRK